MPSLRIKFGVGFLAILVSVLRPGPVSAALVRPFMGVQPDSLTSSIYHPRTPQEIEWACRVLVNLSDGVDADEAKLIAQRQMVRLKKQGDYDIAKPKIFAEDEKAWKVRFPAYFSLTHHNVPPPFIVSINKKTGAVTGAGPQEASH